MYGDKLHAQKSIYPQYIIVYLTSNKLTVRVIEHEKREKQLLSSCPIPPLPASIEVARFLQDNVEITDKMKLQVPLCLLYQLSTVKFFYSITCWCVC